MSDRFPETGFAAGALGDAMARKGGFRPLNFAPEAPEAEDMATPEAVQRALRRRLVYRAISIPSPGVVPPATR